MDNKSKIASSTTSLWQHPYVDVFKEFKILPISDWKQCKKHGDVHEAFVHFNFPLNKLQAKEIGRKVMEIQGSISANNYIQIPHPNSLLKSINLTGRYIYLEVKSPNQGTPYTTHFDFGVADKAHNVRISVSNLFKHFQTSNGNVIQVPMELKSNQWAVVCLDVQQILKKSDVFPPTYKIEGAHSLKSIMLCSSIAVRGVYTSDNLYTHQSLPSDMRFKFSFDNSRWLEFFAWKSFPEETLTQVKSNLGTSLISEQEKQKDRIREEERKKMSSEIDTLLNRGQRQLTEQEEEEKIKQIKKSRVGIMPNLNQDTFSQSENQNVQVASGYILKDQTKKARQIQNKQELIGSHGKPEYVSGSYIGVDLKRSAKLNQDPILELKHIIGYSPDKCLNLKWSRYQNENVVIFTSGGTIIAMDVNNNNQKRFFFGHSAPISTFDINSNGTLLASAQEGKNSIIRIWEYVSGRCISMVTMPVNQLKCLAFSYDGKFLASVGKDSHNREMIIVWDITRITKGEKPEIVAKQTSDFNILCLKFSPIDSSRMASCGKENIRFWRIKENGSIRGSAVVLNQHARNSVFTTLDFEYGARSVDPKENESLKRLYVGSKHGVVFQINYHTESLEANYQTNDSAIYSIAVNEAFCVTGSEDTYLRVWPLDFSEFFMEAKHEGTVCSVDISTDGLKVVCGTQYGSLGILDKSNQKYRTLLRSHTDQILSMDFHVAKRNIITVSRDKTIRLWDIENYDQVYEFSSSIDQPLSIAAHPVLPLFSCGFETGIMRVFDIERTCVADEFSQFNKPLVKLAYSPNGELLVTCCQDGGIAIHNARRQHLPTKMLHLEFPPEHVHVAFTKLTHSPYASEGYEENQDPNQLAQTESKFAVMGEQGNNVIIYDTNSFIVRHQIQAQHLLRQFEFANNNREIALVTTDCRVRFYSLAKYEGILLREISTAHRGNVVSLSISNNSGYMLTGGEDNMIKVWDYEANKTIPYFFQSFIGHTYPVKNLMFNPLDNGVVFSAGEKDGIYVWNFYGDTQTEFSHRNEQEITMQKLGSSLSQPKLSQTPSILEKMRQSRKETKQQNLQNKPAEDSFILPTFKQLQALEQVGEEEQQQEEAVFAYQEVKRERQLTYNHYAGASKIYEIEGDASHHYQEEQKDKTIDATLINGYDGFGGVHNNLVWNSSEKWAAYTLNNKLIFEDTKTRDQTIFAESTVQLSTLTISPNQQYIAVGEGQTNKFNNSYIFLYDAKERKLLQKLTFHQKGVQSLAFSNDSNYLISVGVQGENTLAIWDIAQGLVIKSALLKHYATNAVKVDPYIEEGYVMFCTVGNSGAFSFWRLDLEEQQLQTFDVEVPIDFQQSHFTSLDFTPYLGAPYNTYLILLTASDGSMAAYDQKQNQFVDFGNKRWCISGEVGHVTCKNNTVVLGSSTGTIARYPIVGAQVFPQDSNAVTILKTDGAITSISMDANNNEGMVGTASGSIYYANFDEKTMIRVVSKAAPYQTEITQLQINHANPSIFLTSCSSNSGVVKVWTTATIDQVMKFNGVTSSPVNFILTAAKGKKYSVIGHRNGIIKVVSLETLKIEAVYQLPLYHEEEEVTTAVFSPNGINFAVGTNQGSAYVGSLKEEVTGKPKLTFGKLENITKSSANAITSIEFSIFDPIGSLLISFDNGTIKTWQSSVKNEQFMQLLEMQQKDKSATQFDLSEVGYQQFDLVDTFDIFENPHGVEELSEEDQRQLKVLYGNKKHKWCSAKFAPGSTSADLYYSFVSSLQYIYVRNYIQRGIVKRIPLQYFPTCLSLLDYNTLLIEDSETKGGESVLAVIGTKEGKVLAYKLDSSGQTKRFETKGGLSYGAITALDVYQSAEEILAASSSGEILSFSLVENLNE